MVNYKEIFRSKNPQKKLISVKDSITMLLSLGQDRTSFQNSEDTLQRRSKCSKDSGSSLQNVQFGECKRPRRNNLSFLKTMLLRILYWHSLRLESSVLRKRREYHIIGN